MAYPHSSVPRALSRSNESWQTSSMINQAHHHVPASTSKHAPQDPRLHNYGVISVGNSESDMSINTQGVQGPNHHFPAFMPSLNMPLPGHSGVPAMVSTSVVQSDLSHHIRSPSLLPTSTCGYLTPPVMHSAQHLMTHQQKVAYTSPLPPRPPSWFNPSNPVFPPIPRHQHPGVTPPIPPSPFCPFPNALPSPPLPFPGPPYQNPPSFPTMMAQPAFLRPSFAPPHQWTPRPSAPINSYNGLPGFNPVPAPIGVVERMGLAAVKGQETVVAGGRVSGQFPGQADVSDQFISDWMKRVEISYMRHQQHRSELMQNNFKIPEARHLLSRSVELLSLLRASHHYLASLPTDSTTLWNRTTLEQVNQYKEELLSIRMRFESGDTIDHLSRKLTKCKDKRARWKQCRSRRRATISARRERAEIATENWLQERRQEQLKAKTELSVQKAAAGVLGDVKKKINELQRYINLVKALKELRDVRREASRKKGDAPPIEADELFFKTHQSLADLLSQQAVVYDQEEHALRVLMAEEVKEKMTQEREREEASRRVPVEPCPLPHPLPSDPMAPFNHYYRQAESSIEARASIRCEWDCFKSNEGTTFPDDFDSPPAQPSTAQWAEYLKDKRTIQS